MPRTTTLSLHSFSLFQNKLKKEIIDASNDANEPSGTIKVVLKGQKEVLTLTKLPEDAVVTSYKPDIKSKEGKVSNPDKTVKEGTLRKSDLKEKEEKKSSPSRDVNNSKTQQVSSINSTVSK